MTIYFQYSGKGFIHEKLSVKPDSGTETCQHLQDSDVSSNLSIINLVITFIEYITIVPTMQTRMTFFLRCFFLERKWRKLGLAVASK